MGAFLSEQFNDDKWWVALRNNFKTERHFVKACYEKIDGLRILQYLKANQPSTGKTDEECLKDFFDNYYSNKININLDSFTFVNATTTQLNEIRDLLCAIEEEFQYNKYKQ